MPALGTPGFVGSRLREAREARGISGITLAELVGVTRTAISQYEHDHTSPTPDKLYLIASKLSLPVDFFLLPPRPEVERVVFYRSQVAATKAARNKAEARLEWMGDIIRYLALHVELPRPSMPDMTDAVADLSVQRPLPGSFIEAAAAEARQFFGLGNDPIPNVIRLLEAHGVIGTRGIMETLAIDAFSVAFEDGRPCFFLGADKDSAARSRFDAAHELGHFVLHRGLAKRSMTAAERTSIEADAHRFAGAFLLPARGFAQDLRAPTLEAMLTAKSRWGASVGAMIHRCEDLEILHPREAHRLWVARTRRGWHRHEPLDEELPIERPTIASAAIELIVREGVQSRGQIVAALSLNPSDIESLAGLASGYLDDEPLPVRLIDRVLSSHDAGASRIDGPARVVEFPRS